MPLGLQILIGYLVVGFVVAIAQLLGEFKVGHKNFERHNSPFADFAIWLFLWIFGVIILAYYLTTQVRFDYIVRIIFTKDQDGYWLQSRNGNLFPFGNAWNWEFGSGYKSARVKDDVANFRVDPNGRIMATIDQPHFEGITADHPIMDALPTKDGQGLLLVTAAGKVYNLGNAPHFGDLSLNPEAYGLTVDKGDFGKPKPICLVWQNARVCQQPVTATAD